MAKSKNHKLGSPPSRLPRAHSWTKSASAARPMAPSPSASTDPCAQGSAPSRQVKKAVRGARTCQCAPFVQSLLCSLAAVPRQDARG